MEGNRQRGFTLIELMVAIAISSMLIAVVAMAFTGQSRSYNSEQDIVSLQQDMRSALQLMAREIRMAGYDPTRKADAGFSIATSSNLQFTMDTNGDEDTDDSNEDIRYSINGSAAIGREIRGPAPAKLPGGLQPVAANIDRLAYEYYLDDETWTQTPADLTKIRAVKIMILGHSDRETAGAVDTSTFRPPLEPPAVPPNWTPAAPGRFHWRMMSLVVQCRNMQFKKG